MSKVRSLCVFRIQRRWQNRLTDTSSWPLATYAYLGRQQGIAEVGGSCLL
jgi:hypothetical protein